MDLKVRTTQFAEKYYILRAMSEFGIPHHLISLIKSTVRVANELSSSLKAQKGLFETRRPSLGMFFNVALEKVIINKSLQRLAFADDVDI